MKECIMNLDKSNPTKWISLVFFMCVYLCVLSTILDNEFSLLNSYSGQGIALIVIFPVFLGIVFYLLFFHDNNFKLSLCTKTMFMCTICLLVSLFLLLIEMRYIEINFSDIASDTMFFKLFFKYGEYHDVALKHSTLMMLYVGNVTFLNYVCCSVLGKNISDSE